MQCLSFTHLARTVCPLCLTGLVGYLATTSTNALMYYSVVKSTLVYCICYVQVEPDWVYHDLIHNLRESHHSECLGTCLSVSAPFGHFSMLSYLFAIIAQGWVTIFLGCMRFAQGANCAATAALSILLQWWPGQGNVSSMAISGQTNFPEASMVNASAISFTCMHS